MSTPTTAAVDDTDIEQIDLRPITETAEQILSGGPLADGSWDEKTWQVLAESGLTLIELPEQDGGGGGALREAAEVVRVAGARSARMPLAETALVASWGLHAAGLPVPAGPLSVAPLSVAPQSVAPPSGPEGAGGLQVAPAGDGWSVQGTVRRVPYGRVAERVVLVGTGPDGPVLLCADPRTATCEEGANLAGEPRDTLTFHGGVVEGGAVDAGLVQLLTVRMALSRVVLAAGAAQTVLDLVLRHVAEREQFGRPIGKFQAVQQLVAELAGEVQAVTLGAEAACHALVHEQASYAEMAVGSAKVVTAQSSGRIAAIAHQLFGGIGVTHEHALHRSTTRLWSWREEGGTEGQWSDRLAERVLDPSAPPLWEQIVGR